MKKKMDVSGLYKAMNLDKKAKGKGSSCKPPKKK